MSGFEIVGVVLGSIPLLVAAFENYQEGIRTVQRFLKYDREVQRFIRNLRTEKCKLENVCEKLLLGQVDDHCIEAMVADPFGIMWQDKEIQQRAKLRLWRSYPIFENTVKEINTLIEEMKEKLGAGPEENWYEYSTPAKQLNRISFTLNRASFTEIITRIRECVSDLEGLIILDLELEPRRKVRSRAKLFNLVRGLSSSIYRAISASLTCGCNHGMSMRLSAWSAVITPCDDEDVFMQGLKIYMALSSEGQDWEELIVQAEPSQSGAESLSKSQPTEGCSSAAKKKSSMRFTSLLPLASSPTPKTIQIQLSTRPAMGSVAMEVCRTRRPTDQAHWHCSVQDKSIRCTRYYSISPVTPTYSQDEGDMSIATMISLREVLGSGTDLKYRQRLQLAVFVASGVLQLHKTPWLPGALRSDNIYFIRRGKSAVYENAFVIAQEDDLAYAVGLPGRCNPTVLALGILLVELIQGQTIDSLRQPGDTFGQGLDSVADYMTAHRLLRNIYQSSPNYESAVRRCITGDFRAKKLDLEDEVFRQEMYESVVALLEEDLSRA